MNSSLRLNQLSKHFAQGTEKLEILKDLSLELRVGETLAIVGQSGSGKSTLLSLIAGFETPDQGSLEWFDQSTKPWSPSRWAQFRRESLGFIFQSYHLIPYLNAVENVALPLRLLKKENAATRAEEALKRLGLGHRSTHLPHLLSGGERQRVAIARAMIHSPKLILADEPTGSLDSETGAKVLSVFFSLLKEFNQSAILVTHSHAVAKRCDRVLELKAGQLWSN